MSKNEAALKLARTIVAAQQRNAGAKALVLEGAWDRTETMRCTLAAILEVTERAAIVAWLQKTSVEHEGIVERNTGNSATIHLSMAAALRHAADAIEQGLHHRAQAAP